MILGMFILFGIMTFVFFSVYDATYKDSFGVLGTICFVLAIVTIIYGFVHGFISYPPTEGTHQGVITAVDLEGVFFRRYEVYLKSSGYTDQSDETKYLIYDYEKDLAEELKNNIGKKVKLHYGHDGGYIPWNSCGTYHIKSVEIMEE